MTRAEVVGRPRPDPEVHQIDGVADDLSSDDATSSDESQNGSDGEIYYFSYRKNIWPL